MTKNTSNKLKRISSSFRLSQDVLAALEELVETSRVRTNKTREVELAIKGRLQERREHGENQQAQWDIERGD